MLEVDGAAVVAQELKRPLLELRQLALGFDGNGVDDEKIRLEMVKVADQAMRQVDDLTKIRRLNDGGFEMGPVAVRALCDDVMKEIAKLYTGQRCEVVVKYSNRSRLVNANPELLKSVVFNLVLDATKYIDVDARAELKVRESKGKVEINVRDFGPALPMDVWREVQGNLRAPREIAMRPGSSALGLYIASKFSKYMNAEVGAVRHNDGVSFFVKLPVTRQMSMWGA
ncbi:HAMP domain-containing histidine kinase [Candidatus Saccharibacteria bacterium]|nr:HAMP domain-containing histidine kinase [Candidatus Saccharibacteria bacterium]